MLKIILPDLGDGITQAKIVHWNFQEGQRVSPEDDVVELVTDKAVFNVPAPAEGGVIKKIYYKEGQEAPVGSVLADLV
jgi:pyruvate/2-oxoglutarate dehydrogenase complex dihydrolipoamide acyltransferase (E2) component